MKTKSRRSAVTLGVCALIASSVLAAPTASASTESTEGSTPDRTIYINEPAPVADPEAPIIESQRSATSETLTTEGAEFPVIPEDGETVRVVYTDAVSEIVTSAACTRSLTAHEPFAQGGKLHYVGGWRVSKGCSSGGQLTLAIYNGFSMVANGTKTARPSDYTTTSEINTPCKSTKSTKYYGITAWKNGGKVQGDPATVACRA